MRWGNSHRQLFGRGQLGACAVFIFEVMETKNNKEKIEEVLLERIKLGLNIPFDSYCVQELNVNVVNGIGDTAIAEIQTAFMGQREKIYKEVAFKIPLNQFQIFKQKYFPKWLLKIYPIEPKYCSKTLEFDISVIFPKMKNINQEKRLFLTVSEFNYGK